MATPLNFEGSASDMLAAMASAGIVLPETEAAAKRAAEAPAGGHDHGHGHGHDHDHGHGHGHGHGHAYHAEAEPAVAPVVEAVGCAACAALRKGRDEYVERAEQCVALAALMQRDPSKAWPR